MKKLYITTAIIAIACLISARPTTTRQEWAERTENGTYKTAEGDIYRIGTHTDEVYLFINDNGTIWKIDDTVISVVDIDGKLNR